MTSGRLYTLAKMNTATTGTGTITLSTVASGFLTFAQAGVSNGETVTYCIEDGANREVGYGVYSTSGTTLTRNVLKSTNSDAAINLSGTATVGITAAAENFYEWFRNIDANGFSLGMDDNTGINDDSGNEQVRFRKTTSAVNYVEVTNTATGTGPSISSAGDDTNVNLDLVAKGSGVVRANGVEVVTLTGAQTLTNKTLTSPTLTAPLTVANGGTGQATEAEAIGELIQALTADSTPDNAADYIATYDASADTGKKVLLSILARDKLTADRTYYVRTDGSDSNTGLVNNSGGAFLTIQKALTTVAALDISIYNVTIQVADGTYTANLTVTSPWLGSGTVTVNGNSGTPANVVITSSSGSTFDVSGGGRLTITNCEIRSADHGVLAQTNGTIVLGAGIRFGACTGYHSYAQSGGTVRHTVSYSIVGNAIVHWNVVDFGLIQANSLTITLTGTPAFSYAFASGERLGAIIAIGDTFSGAATGQRYNLATNTVVATGGGGASYLPGNVAGTAGTGAQYS